MTLFARYNRLTLWNKIAFWGGIASFVSLGLYFLPTGETGHRKEINVQNSPGTIVQNAVASPNAVQIGNLNVHPSPPKPRWLLQKGGQISEHDAALGLWVTKLFFSPEPEGKVSTAEIRVTFDKPFLKVEKAIVSPPPMNTNLEKFPEKIEDDSKTYHCGQTSLADGSGILLTFQSLTPLKIVALNTSL